jgi:DNA-binding MarR family transcriptional regulator
MPRRAPTAPADVRASLDALRRIVQALRAVGDEGPRRSGLSGAQRFALQQLAPHPGASLNELAALTFTHHSSVSVVVQRLVARKLIAKVAARDDRRRVRLEVTAKGRTLLHRTPPAVQERLIEAIAALPAADRRALARALRRVAMRVAPDALAHPPMLFEGKVERQSH